MDFVLFEKLAKLNGIELYLLLGALLLAAALIIAITLYGRRQKGADEIVPVKSKGFPVRILVQGALCVSLSFILSYIKLFSMPLGGSIALCSILPIAIFAVLYGPAYGFAAAFVYSLLQVVQGAWIVHWAQFILDYFIAFTCYGLAGFFRRSLPLGVAVAGLSRMVISMISGMVFFASSAADAGYASLFAYSFIYNGSTIGIETLMCVIVAFLPPVKRMVERIRVQYAQS